MAKGIRIALVFGTVIILCTSGVILARKLKAKQNWQNGATSSLLFTSLKSPEVIHRLFPSEPNSEIKLEKEIPFSIGKSNFVIGVFATYQLYGGQRIDSHASAPTVGLGLFEVLGQGRLRCLDIRPKFIEHGSYGSLGEVNLVNLGPSHPAIVLRGGYTSQGVTVSGASYYRLLTPACRLDLNEILKVRESYDDSGFQTNDNEVTSIESVTSIEPVSGSDWYSVKVAYKGGLPAKDGKIVVGHKNIDESLMFKYDFQNTTYKLENNSIPSWLQALD